MRFRGSLAARVALLATIAVGLSVAFVAAAAYITVKQQLIASLDNSLRTRAQTAARSITVIEGQKAIPRWVVGATDFRIATLNNQGEVMYSTDRGQGHSYIYTSDAEVAVARGDTNWSVRTVYTADGAFRVGAVPGPDPGTALIMAQPLRTTQDALDELGLVLTLIGLAGVVAAGFAGWAVARQGLRPVRRLSDAVE
jgi:two-component system sensor histidine kinase MprB